MTATNWLWRLPKTKLSSNSKTSYTPPCMVQHERLQLLLQSSPSVAEPQFPAHGEMHSTPFEPKEDIHAPSRTTQHKQRPLQMVSWEPLSSWTDPGSPTNQPNSCLAAGKGSEKQNLKQALEMILDHVCLHFR